jgi:hypothetical protein
MAAVPRLPPGSAALEAHLRTEGWAVARGVLEPSECDVAMGHLWNFLEALGTGVRRDDIRTWDNTRWPSAEGSTFVASHGATHSEAAWFVRSRPTVRATFGALWHARADEQLLVSFDALNVHRPWKHRAGSLSWRARSATGFHADQSSMHPRRFVEPAPAPAERREYVQGSVNLVGMSPHSGGHIVVPRSHTKFAALMARNRVLEKGFPIPLTEPALEGAIMPHMEAGDMLLWDSRTIQCAAPGFRAPPTQAGRGGGGGGGGGGGEGVCSPALLHVEVYVTMSPKAKASSATLAQRRAAVRDNIALGCHAAHHLLRHTPEAGPGPGPFRVVPPAVLGPEARALVG